MASIGDGIPKSTMALAGVLWGILAVLGLVILTTVLDVKQTQATQIANQGETNRRLASLEASDAKQNEHIRELQVEVARK